MLKIIAFLRNTGDICLSIPALIVAVAIAFLPASFRTSGQDIKGWRGIVPLHSTRADAEARLGTAQDKCKCVFRSAAETIVVDYAEAPCKGPVQGWNVPRDTVLQLRVTPKKSIAFSELKLNKSTYIESRDGDDVMTVYYTNLQEGIKYAVQSGQVIYAQYVPSAKDNGLRCEGFPSYEWWDDEISTLRQFSETFGHRNVCALRRFCFSIGKWTSIERLCYLLRGKSFKSERG
jgi:hypothetical protein